MDINNNLMQTNTFIKGMNTDTSDALLSNEQYRYAENIRIVTDTESNSGEAHLIEGTVTSQFDIYQNINNTKSNVTSSFMYSKILATNTIRDIGVAIVQTKVADLVNGGDKDGWSILKLDFNKNEGYLLFGPCTEPITPDEWDKNGKVISTVLRYESDNNIKLYISDLTGNHPIIMFPIHNDEYVGDNFNSTFAYQNQLLPTLTVSVSTSSGSLISGMVQYAYRLYSKYGAATPISPLSKTLSLYKDNVSGYAAKKRSGRAVDITYPTINYPKLDYIQVYRISYLESGQQPTINLIKDEPVNTGSAIDTGTNDIQTISVAEFLSMVDFQIIPKQIESKGDYLFAANLKYAQDNVDDLFENFDARAYSSGNKYPFGGADVYIFSQQDARGLELKNIDTQYLKHAAFDNTAGYTTYNSLYWDTLNSAQLGFRDETVNIAPDTYNGVGVCLRWKYIYAPVYDDGDEVYAKESTVDNAKRIPLNTFRSEEVYRFGVRLFDNHGRASSVKWIADIMIPPSSYIDNDSQGNCYLKLTGIEFSINNSYDDWEDNWKNVSAYEIVRAPRTVADRCTVTQGITGYVMQPRENNGKGLVQLEQICTSGFFTQDPVHTNSVADKDAFDDTIKYQQKADSYPEAGIMFASPEYCYQPDDVKDILQSYQDGIQIRQIAKYNTEFNLRQQDGIVYYTSKQTSNSDMPYSLVLESGNGWKIDPTTMDYNANWSGVTEYSQYGKTTIDSSNTPTRWFLNYIRPTYSAGVEKYTNTSRNILKMAFIKAPKYSDFANQQEFSYDNNVVSIGDKQFVNWSVPMMLKFRDTTTKNSIKAKIDNIDYEQCWATNNWDHSLFLYPISSGGSTILFKADYSTGGSAYTHNNPSALTTMPRIYITDVRKPVIPYGGYNKTSIDNSKYISYGDFRKIDLNTVNNINVFSGDTKISPFVYNAAHSWYDSTYKAAVKMATVYRVVIECDVDTKAQYGSLYGSEQFYDYRLQDYACGFDTFTQEKDAYLYNTVYNSTPDVLSWTTDAENTKKFNNYDTRIHYSEQKTNNEEIDSWLRFKSANFIDTDTRHGEITGMKLFKDKLIFWQENAAGIAAVNERIVLKDASDNKVQLGTGGVLERTDYISTMYGLKPRQLAYEVSNDHLYWWDSDRKELLQYTDGYNVIPLISTKQAKNYINNMEDESETPTLIYDNKYKELICNLRDEQSLVYSEQLQQFTSIYTFNPAFKWQANTLLYLTKNKLHQYLYNETSQQDGVQLFGEDACPHIEYVVNKDSQYNKVFDIQTFGGRFYGGNTTDPLNENINPLSKLYFGYKTPLKQTSGTYGNALTNIEYDFRLTIPRNGAPNEQIKYGDRMRGKTMQCMFESTSNDLDFSLQYITTKFRMSWT